MNLVHLITFLSQLITLNCYPVDRVSLGIGLGPASVCYNRTTYQQAFFDQLQDLIPYVLEHAMSHLLCLNPNLTFSALGEIEIRSWS